MSRSLLYHHPLPSPDDYLFETLEDYSFSSSLLDLDLHLSMDLFSPDEDYVYGEDDNYLYSGGDDLLDRLPLDDDDDDWRSLDDLVLGGTAAPSEPPDLEGPSLDLVLGIGGASSESADVDLDLDLDLNLNLDAASLEEGDAANSPPTWIDATAAVEELLWEEELDDLPLEEAAFDLARGDAEADAHAWDVLVALDEIDGEMQELFFGAEEDGLGIDEVEVGDEPSTSGRAPAARSVVEGLPLVAVAEGEGERVVCAICKEEVAAGGTVKRLPCSHGYHEECIVPWLTMRNTCPVCRHTLPTEEDLLLRGRRSNRRGGHLMGFEEDFIL